eukprot:gene57310-biopygen88593
MSAPTPHPCLGSSHGCDKGPGGVCNALANSQWTCDCKPGWVCITGCTTHVAHVCEAVTHPPSGPPAGSPSSAPIVHHKPPPPTTPLPFTTNPATRRVHPRATPVVRPMFPPRLDHSSHRRPRLNRNQMWTTVFRLVVPPGITNRSRHASRRLQTSRRRQGGHSIVERLTWRGAAPDEGPVRAPQAALSHDDAHTSHAGDTPPANCIPSHQEPLSAWCCADYVTNGWCGQPWVPDYANEGKDADAACCACGGGTTATLAPSKAPTKAGATVAPTKAPATGMMALTSMRGGRQPSNESPSTDS